jgi:hypothetical protein
MAKLVALTLGLSVALSLPFGSYAADPGAIAKARVDKMDFAAACAQLGRILRTPAKSRSEAAAQSLSQISDKFGVGGNEWDIVARRKVQVGMSECAAYASWGRPERVNRTATAGGSMAQWSYGDGNYLYIGEGKVTAAQNSTSGR